METQITQLNSVQSQGSYRSIAFPTHIDIVCRSGEVMPIAAIHGQEVPASALLDNRGGIWGEHDHHWQQAH